MSCPSCGAKLEVSNQQFCHECGGRLPDFSKGSGLVQESAIPSDDLRLQQIQKNSIKTSYSRPLSKRSLAFGIISLIIGLTTFNLGTSLITEPNIFTYLSRRNVFISLGVVNLVGIVFGIVSTIFNKQAKNSEMLNKAMKAGGTLGTIGLTINILLTITAFIVAFRVSI